MPRLLEARVWQRPFLQSFPWGSCSSEGLFQNQSSFGLLRHMRPQPNTAFRRQTLDRFQTARTAHSEMAANSRFFIHTLCYTGLHEQQL